MAIDPLTAISLIGTGISVGDAVVPRIADNIPGPEWLGKGIQAGVGGIPGMLLGWNKEDPTDKLIEEYLSGEIPDSTRKMLTRLIGDRFEDIRTESGASAARRGVADSTIAQRQQDDLYENEQQALADAFLQNLMARQQYGMSLLHGQEGARGEAVGGGLATLNKLFGHMQDKEAHEMTMSFLDKFLETSNPNLAEKPNTTYSGSNRTRPWYQRYPVRNNFDPTTGSGGRVNSARGGGQNPNSRRAAGAFGLKLTDL